jgi:hypothetical protein
MRSRSANFFCAAAAAFAFRENGEIARAAERTGHLGSGTFPKNGEPVTRIGVFAGRLV